MIIHNPKISGSLQFPSDENGNLITLQVQNGTLETITLNSSGVDQNVQPSVNYSGSFTGSFVGDGSNLTGVSAINIDALGSLGGATVAQGDNLVVSDAGTEKKVTFSNLEDSVFGNISGDVTIAAGGAATIANSFKNDSLNSATGSYLTTVDISSNTNLAVSDTTEVNMILTGDTISAELIGGVVSGSAQISGVTNSQLAGSIANGKLANSAITISGTSVSLGGAITDETLFGGTGVVSGSNQIATTFAQTILDDANAGAVRTTLGVDAAGTVNYTLPTNLAGDDIDIDTTALTGATVISDLDINITTNTSGLVTDANGTVSTRDLTAGDLSLGNVDNTADSAKPVSTAQQTALDLKANIASPTFTGTPISTTPSANDDSTKIATTAYVQQELTDLIGTAGSTVDTLGELSASLASDSGSLASLVTTVGTKLAKSSNLSDLSNASTARTNLGVAIGSDVQAFNSTLATVAGGTYAGDNSIVTLGTVTTGDVQTILPSGVVSSSAQVSALAGTSNDEITLTAGAGLDGGGAFTLNQSGDETITFTVGDGVISGSAQVTHDSTTGFVANEHIDHSSVSITAGTGLNGGGTIASTRTLNVDDDYLNTSLNAFTASNANTSLNAATSSYLTTVDISSNTNLAVSDTTEVNMILSGDTISAELIGGVVSGSDQVASTFAQTILDDTSAGAVRTTLGVDAAGTDNSTNVTLANTNYLSISGQEVTGGTVPISSGGTGATSAGAARTALGVDAAGTVNYTLPTNLAGDDIDVDTGALTGATVVSDIDINITTNTSGLVTDANGSVSTRTLTASDLSLGNVTNESKSTMFTDAALTGNPTAPTQTANDSSTKIATTAYVQTELTDLVGTAGSTLDTLGELSASLASDSGSLASLVTTVGTKLAKSSNLSDLSNASTARSNLGVDASGTDNSTNVTLAGTPNYITISGQEITRNTIDIGDDTNLAVSDTTEVNMILSGDTISAELIGGVVSGSGQIDIHSTSGYVADEHIDHSSVTLTAGTGLNGGGNITTSRTFNVDDDYKNTSLNAATSSYLTTVDISSNTNLAVSDTSQVDMILSGDTLSANLKGGVISGSAQIAALGYSTTDNELTTEEVQDIAGALVATGGTKTGISITYDDANGNMDFVVASQTDENFTSDDHSKLDGIETSADVTDATNVASAGALMDSEVTNLSFVKGLTKGISDGNVLTANDAVADNDFLRINGTEVEGLTASEVRTALNVESGADVTDATNVASAGALMDSELTDLAGVKGVTISTLQVKPSEGAFEDGDKTKLDAIEAGANVTDAANVLTSLPSGVVSGSDQVASTFAQTILDDTSASAVRTTLGVDAAGTVNYTLPTNLAGDDIDVDTGALTGASVISDLDFNITTNSSGLVTDANGSVSTRTLTLSDLGYTGATDANNYVLPTNLAGDDIDIDTTALSGATVISDLDINITTNTSGLVTDANGSVSTRTLSASDLSLGNVTNESKSTMFTSPTFTGTTAAPTPSADDDSTKIATTAYVQGELTGLIGGAPAAFDTLLEISASIANGDSDVVALTTTVGTKLAKSSNLSDLSNAGTARTNLGVDAAGTDNSTNVSLTGTPDYITISGQTITRNQIDLANDVTGVLPSANLDSDTAHLSGTQTFSGAKSFSSAVNIDSTTASTSKTTGALIVDGGVGVAGALNVGGDVVAFASSDERLKDNIELISNPIEKVQSLKGVTWNWNSNADELQQSLPNVGVIAQDVEKVLPQLVTDRDNGFKGVDYAKLTGLLIEAVKDQQKQIDELKSKLS